MLEQQQQQLQQQHTTAYDTIQQVSVKEPLCMGGAVCVLVSSGIPDCGLGGVTVLVKEPLLLLSMNWAPRAACFLAMNVSCGRPQITVMHMMCGVHMTFLKFVIPQATRNMLHASQGWGVRHSHIPVR